MKKTAIYQIRRICDNKEYILCARNRASFFCPVDEPKSQRPYIFFNFDDAITKFEILVRNYYSTPERGKLLLMVSETGVAREDSFIIHPYSVKIIMDEMTDLLVKI